MIPYFKPAFLMIALCGLSFTAKNIDPCSIRNTAFKADEEIKMKVFYSTLGMYVGAGEAPLPLRWSDTMAKLFITWLVPDLPILFLMDFLKCVTGMKVM